MPQRAASDRGQPQQPECSPLYGPASSDIHRRANGTKAAARGTVSRCPAALTRLVPGGMTGMVSGAHRFRGGGSGKTPARTAVRDEADFAVMAAFSLESEPERHLVLVNVAIQAFE